MARLQASTTQLGFHYVPGGDGPSEWGLGRAKNVQWKETPQHRLFQVDSKSKIKHDSERKVTTYHTHTHTHTHTHARKIRKLTPRFELEP